MDLFHNAISVRLKSHHGKYLYADEDEDSVRQDRNESSNNAWWTVEYVSVFRSNNQNRWIFYDDGGFESNKTIIRLKSCYGRYLTASNHRFVLRANSWKVVQTLTNPLDSSVQWELIREGNRVKLKTHDGRFLRANGGPPPWRNSVTHNKPYRTSSQDFILWEVG